MFNNLPLFYDDKTTTEDLFDEKHAKCTTALKENCKTNPRVFKLFGKIDLIISLNYLPYFLFLPLFVITERS